MEPNKFEENIRTKLEEREIQPSSEAWAKLEAQLGAPKSNNRTLWYAVAASLVAILVVGSFLLKDDAPVSNQIVEQVAPSEIKTDVDAVTAEEIIEEDSNNSIDQTVQNKEIFNKISNEPKSSIATIKETQKVEQKFQPKEEMAVAKESEKETSVTNIQEKDFINLKVDEVVAKVSDLQENETEVTQEAIERLLEKAQRDIAKQRLLDQATTKIDPASLLNDVESELEQSFRDKVFDALGEGFKKIRTAVVERNN